MFYFLSAITFAAGPVLISLYLCAVTQIQKNSVSGFRINLYSVPSDTFIEVIHRFLRLKGPMSSDLTLKTEF